ncbi:hypothetical protein PIB30_053260 [Stylosanthes scabra]|uniref:Uncharacterized protein n=1 Tax=Stylosanthes scabra TaxID=79078 RepID=A0ABU6ZH89_9FABA|nr:hypothetical protein [Stylosanthes scabra]
MSNVNSNANVESNSSDLTNSQTSAQNSSHVDNARQSSGNQNVNGGNNRNGNGGNNHNSRTRNVQQPFTPPPNTNLAVQFGTNPPFFAETSRSIGVSSSSNSGISIQTVRNLIEERIC